MIMNQLDEFLNYLRVERNHSVNTLRGYRGDIEQFISEMKITDALEITKPIIRAYLSKLIMQSKPSSPATRNRKLTTLRTFCKYLVMESYMSINPTLDICYATLEKRLPKTITVEQTVNLLDSIDSLRDKAALETLYGTGVRVQELVNIKVNDIDFSSGRVVIFGKGRKERIVPLSRGALSSLSAYLKSKKTESPYVFESPANAEKAITTRSMQNIVSKHGDANNINMSPHKFRHSIATHLLANGMDIRKIQEFLGHSNINTTTIYAQVAIDQMSNQFHLAHPRG